ncbi:hypothetical protein FE257_008986 [Aspergillus nanangensis]|uniref:cysteine--tRNA ligase n=1 Tax=Aspergillus nanangensis TaxID=2582783 RepID=A0AAD4GXN6_ASPNN|nr:hypothetical protein FE257_008986 [Aspergillus nanangensis]
MASTVREQPPWIPPQVRPNVQLPPLKIYNSLTRRKDDFVPIDPAGKAATWYTCGPTVYDDAHMGHARNYMSTDILRRILKDYFGFQVKYVMNITDIDDKIILRGRQHYLLEQFKQEQDGSLDGPVPETVITTTKAAVAHYIKKNLPLLSETTTPENYATESEKTYKKIYEGKALEEGTLPGDKEAKLKVHLKTVSLAVEALQSHTKLSEFYIKTEDILLPYLDSLYGSSIDSNDHSIFTRLTEKFEKRFFEDMEAVNVLYPDVLTRVTEYVPQVVAFIEKVIASGFAYATPDGSVYFDIDAFEKAGHDYARLEPWNRNDKGLLADAEGSLSNKTTTKRNESDFALWKASKPGEPSWPSPWAPGRPGWHIECSVMASDVLGKAIDIHSGGADLRFPHHDNELAQSEAYWSEGPRVQWVNYFIHTGHLSIQGMKMSKSLKNFTTIRAALSQPQWSARALRVCFLLGAWESGVEVTEDLLKGTTAWEGKLNNFFLKSKEIANNHTAGSVSGTKGEQDTQLLAALEKAKSDLHAGLCDSFNTPVAMRAISDLVSEFNVSKGVSDETVLETARWITRMVTIFGLDAKGDLNDANRVGWSGLDLPASAQAYVYPVSRLRDQIRQMARSGTVDYTAISQLADTSVPTSPPTSTDSASNPYEKVTERFRSDVKGLSTEKAAAKDLLDLCDQLRDTHLWNLGIYIEDRDAPIPALVRPVDRSLQEARAEKDMAASAKLEAKQKREAEEAEKRRLLNEKAKISHLEMFKTPEYSAWDENGVPTKDKDGEEVAKNKRKKLVKEWERQKKIHEEWLKSNSA